ncbi:MAG: hypothetical protein DRP12_00260 [Candidatus Aenigmatarchaeota archaeon]|nr:MAG: hypothetical protein DRP12_00260 [Candidatus Aenigmarchaeota archaeon]
MNKPKPLKIDVEKELVRGYVGELDLSFLNEILRTKLTEIKQRIESAREGLLQEIKENYEKSRMGYYPEVIVEVANNVERYRTRREVVEGTLQWCMEKILKWFPGDIENE